MGVRRSPFQQPRDKALFHRVNVFLWRPSATGKSNASIGQISSYTYNGWKVFCDRQASWMVRNVFSITLYIDEHWDIAHDFRRSSTPSLEFWSCSYVQLHRVFSSNEWTNAPSPRRRLQWVSCELYRGCVAAKTRQRELQLFLLESQSPANAHAYFLFLVFTWHFRNLVNRCARIESGFHPG